MFCENYIIEGLIICESGLHIGNSNDNLDIGGSENPIIKDAITNLPYIPGSSLKGKLRVLLELNDVQSSESVIENNGKPSSSIDCVATQIFGISTYRSSDPEKNIWKYPTRIIVRDAFPTEDTIKKWKNTDEIWDGVELKYENAVDRINANSYPRNIERIPRGSKFNFEIIFSVYDEDNEKNFLELLKSMKLLEDNYLGGSGTRGFGKVKFSNLKITKRDLNYYYEGKINPKNTLPFDNINETYNFFKKGLEGV